jgi:hypothetical protein
MTGARRGRRPARGPLGVAGIPDRADQIARARRRALTAGPRARRSVSAGDREQRRSDERGREEPTWPVEVHGAGTMTRRGCVSFGDARAVAPTRRAPQPRAPHPHARFHR